VELTASAPVVLRLETFAEDGHFLEAVEVLVAVIVRGPSGCGGNEHGGEGHQFAKEHDECN
jgi:hypothetical protein